MTNAHTESLGSDLRRGDRKYEGVRRNDGDGTLNIKRLNILKRRPQGFRPFPRQHLEIGVILPDALGVLQFQRVGFIGEHVDGMVESLAGGVSEY